MSVSRAQGEHQWPSWGPAEGEEVAKARLNGEEGTGLREEKGLEWEGID